MENKKSYQNLTKDELIRELELSDKIIDGMVKRNNNHRLLTKKERNYIMSKIMGTMELYEKNIGKLTPKENDKLIDTIISKLSLSQTFPYPLD
jgi:hypothetical protein|tara:strand:- start:43 stop:321 length:279 start_codon:yes stop_codon:yes gene_type:complete